MKIDKKEVFPLIGEYLLAVVLGLFLGTIADLVTQSLVWNLFSNALICRIVEAVVCLLILAGSICVTSGRIAYKQKRKDMLTTMLALIPVLVLQLILAFVFQFVSYISGAGFWLGVLFCHGGNGNAMYMDTPQGYFLLGMIVCMVVYCVTACVAQHVGYKQRIKSSEKILKK